MKTVFKSRYFIYAKDPENPQQNQDAFQVDDARGMAVIADGVSSAIFSASWANILTKHIVKENPDPTDTETFSAWLTQLRNEWEQSIDTTNLTWFQRPKLAAGAFSTLVWTQVREIAPPKEGSKLWSMLHAPIPERRCFHVKGYCIGDSCLFHVCPGRTDSESFPGTDLYRAIPLTNSSAFDQPPIVIGSKDLGHDNQMVFQPIDFLAQEGDLVVLATDAVSQWLLRCYEDQAYPRWDLFWTLTQEQWEQELDAMRSGGEIRYDDSTLLVLQLGSSNTFLNPVMEQVEEISEPEELQEEEFIEELDSGLESEGFVEEELEEEIKPEEELISEESEILEELVVEEPVEEPVVEKPMVEEEIAEITEEIDVESVDFEESVMKERPLPTENRLGEMPRRPQGFQFRMASDTKKVQERQNVQDSVNVSRSQKTQASARPQPSTRKVESAEFYEDSEDNSAKLAENWQQLKESSTQIAGILGEQLSEGMSRLGSTLNEGMGRLGSGLNEGMTQAKPKIQGLTQRFSQMFKKKEVSEKENRSGGEVQDDAPKPTRVIDPNRRRYYNPPPRD